MSTTAHLQRKAFKISAIDLGNFITECSLEHSSSWTSGASPHEHSPEGNAAIEWKYWPGNRELESLFAVFAVT